MSDRFLLNERRLRFTVLGEAQPAGSKTAFVNPKTNRAIVTDANKKVKPWQREVKEAAVERLRDDFELFRGAIELKLTFFRPRPKGHYGSGRNAGVVKRSAPEYPITRPDALKLSRGVEDALTGIVWADDAQIVDEHLFKRYGEPARCEIEVVDLG